VDVTFAIIKPDAREKAPEVVKAIEAAGFKVAHSRVLTMTAAQAREFYAEHHGRNFFQGLIDFMTSGECVVLALEKENAVADWRTTIGPTNSVTAREQAPESIRALFGTDNRRNAVHGSATTAAARVELAFFFPKYFVYQRTVAFTMPDLTTTQQEGVEAQFANWGFTTMDKVCVELDEDRARVLAQSWAAEQPYELDPAEDEGTLLLPYFMRPHDPALDEIAAPPKPADGEDGEEPPAEEAAADEAPKEEVPVCPPTKPMNVDKMVKMLTDGEVTIYMLGRYGAVHALQTLVGPQEPAVARFNDATAGTLRAHFGADRNHCAVHASACAATARKHIKLFFPEES
jgi:nucleoside diphosphate kinase